MSAPKSARTRSDLYPTFALAPTFSTLSPEVLTNTIVLDRSTLTALMKAVAPYSTFTACVAVSRGAASEGPVFLTGLTNIGVFERADTKMLGHRVEEAILGRAVHDTYILITYHFAGVKLIIHVDPDFTWCDESDWYDHYLL